VLVIGAGGLGSGCLPYLAAAGVGEIMLVDDDVVDLSNLQRQILHATGDIGRSKVQSAKEKLSALNPHTAIRPVAGRLTVKNAAALLAGVDVAIDGSDNFDTRYALADAAYAARVPLVSAALLRFEAQLSTFKGYLGPPHPCYRCLYPVPPPPGTIATCAAAGVFGAMAGTVGAWQAMEALKEIIDIGDSLSGRLLILDALAANVHTIRIPRNPACACCGVAA
jgi:adenylyltransferase/sulfurtransferase